MAAAIRSAFGAAVDPGPAQERPAYSYNETRQQFHAAAVLRRLANLPGRGPRAPVLGVVDADLFVPDAPFVFGEADRDAMTAVVSVARLKVAGDTRPVGAERLRHRIQVEAVHEVGHLAGLSHCSDSRCAMFLSHSPADSDRKHPTLCANCRTALGVP